MSDPVDVEFFRKDGSYQCGFEAHFNDYGLLEVPCEFQLQAGETVRISAQ